MTDTLNVTVKKDDRYAVVYTEGYINNLGGERVAAACGRLIDEGIKNLILNLEKSTVVNSIGIAILIEVIERVAEINGTLSFCKLTPTIAKTFRIMRLTDAAAIYDSEAEAIDAVQA